MRHCPIIPEEICGELWCQSKFTGSKDKDKAHLVNVSTTSESSYPVTLLPLSSTFDDCPRKVTSGRATFVEQVVDVLPVGRVQCDTLYADEDVVARQRGQGL